MILKHKPITLALLIAFIIIQSCAAANPLPQEQSYNQPSLFSRLLAKFRSKPEAPAPDTVRLIPHAIKRMAERRISEHDIKYVLKTGYQIISPLDPKRKISFGTLPNGRHIEIVTEKKPGSKINKIITVIGIKPSKYKKLLRIRKQQRKEDIGSS